MLPHMKNDSSLKSVPVSRVNSSQRLHQLGSTPKSIPVTPSASNVYVTSSLNPNKHLPITPGTIKSRITTKSQLEVFEKLPVVQQVNALEGLLSELSSDIALFKDETLEDKVRSMIEVNDELRAKIDKLEEHRELGFQISLLEQQQENLNAQAKHILKELISYRTELKQLPRALSKQLRTDDEAHVKDVDVGEILKYAMKLAKFTKAPAAIGNMQLQVHPNNYVWPAEDALRRGMLATASLQEDLLIKHELGDVKEEVKIEENDKNVEDKPPSPSERRGSFGLYGSENKDTKQASENNEQDNNLDLDLFDPDDEFSD